MRCHSVVCGTASQTRSATQSTTRSFTVARNAVIRVYHDAGNVIATHEHTGDFKEWSRTRFGFEPLRCVSAPVTVKTIEANKRIVIEWLGYSDLTTVQWIFASQKRWHTLFVGITEASIGSSGSQVSINDGLITRTSRDGAIPTDAHVSQGRVGP
jgi:hypothetical protein